MDVMKSTAKIEYCVLKCRLHHNKLSQNYFKPAVTEFAPHHTEAKSAGCCSGKSHCYQCGQGRIQGGIWEMYSSHLPTTFKHVFDNYNCSIISNLFDNIKPYITPQARITETEPRKCIIFGETFRFRSKKFKQSLPRNCSKSTKMATTVCKNSKNFWGSMLLDLPRTDASKNNSAGKNYA